MLPNITQFAPKGKTIPNFTQFHLLHTQFSFEDLLIGTTALHLDYSVATFNVRHFRQIPGLSVVQF